MEKQNDALGQRKMLREVNVESNSQQDEQEDCQLRLPGQTVVGWRVRQLHHRLDDASELQNAGRNAADPAGITKPTDDI